MFIEPTAINDLSYLAQPDAPAHSAAQATPSSASFDEQYARARTLANGGQHELAIAAYSALLAQAPGNADVLLGRGLVYSRTGRHALAEADLLAATAAAPDYVDAWLALANVYRWTGRQQQAVAAYDRVLALRPDDAEARSGRGLALSPPEEKAPPAIAPDIPAPASGNTASPDALSSRFDWAATMSGSAARVQGGQYWHDYGLALRRYGKRGSLAAEALTARRFGQHDHAWALDAYVALWPRSYANLRYQRSPVARLFPRTSWRAELYQGLGSGWELSVSKDALDFDVSRVRIYGAGVAKYVGNFYLSWRHTEIESTGVNTDSSGDRALVRYYYTGYADNYVEFAASRGTSDDPLSLVGGRSRSGERSLAWQRYFTPQWGLKLGTHYARQDAGGSERRVSAALTRRW